MKPLNFTCKEKLPYLLNLKPGDEFQTIRKAWENVLITRNIQLSPTGHIIKHKGTREKPAAYKVGEVVTMFWDVLNDAEYFDIKSGIGINHPVFDSSGPLLPQFFNKNLGNIEITEVFKIEMRNYPEYQYRMLTSKHIILNNHWWSVEGGMSANLAKLDGFKSAEVMFKVLDKIYDLSTPKEFWVYRGRKL